MIWRRPEGSRVRQVPALNVGGRVDYCGPASETPGAMHVEVFADNVSGVALMEALDLTAEEKIAFQRTWEKICTQMMHQLGFQEAEDPPAPPPAEG